VCFKRSVDRLASFLRSFFDMQIVSVRFIVQCLVWLSLNSVRNSSLRLTYQIWTINARGQHGLILSISFNLFIIILQNYVVCVFVYLFYVFILVFKLFYFLLYYRFISHKFSPRLFFLSNSLTAKLSQLAVLNRTYFFLNKILLNCFLPLCLVL